MRPNPHAPPPRLASHPNAVILRAGDPASPLFMFTGAGCDWREVTPLAALVALPWSVIGVEAWQAAGPAGAPPRTVEEMGRVAFEAIRAIRPRGPYSLAGYSLGGMMALETAAALARGGGEVQLLALIDSPIHQRFRSAPQRVRGSLDQILRVARMPPGVRYAKVRRGFRQIAARLTDGRRRPEVAPQTLLQRCDAAYRMYRPHRYAGRLILISPARSSGIDFAELWRDYADALEVRRVEGGHHQLVRVRQYVEGLARALNEVLPSGGGPPSGAQTLRAEPPGFGGRSISTGSRVPRRRSRPLSALP